MISITRYHDISCGHRVVGHEGACANLHGHNYRIYFTIETSVLDEVGRVLDFGVVKKLFCEWLDKNWDHRFLVFEDDPYAHELQAIDPTVVIVNFNPTAENIAAYLVTIMAPPFLRGTGLQLTECRVEETRKCSATYSVSK